MFWYHYTLLTDEVRVIEGGNYKENKLKGKQFHFDLVGELSSL